MVHKEFSIAVLSIELDENIFDSTEINLHFTPIDDNEIGAVVEPGKVCLYSEKNAGDS